MTREVLQPPGHLNEFESRLWRAIATNPKIGILTPSVITEFETFIATAALYFRLSTADRLKTTSGVGIGDRYQTFTVRSERAEVRSMLLGHCCRWGLTDPAVIRPNANDHLTDDIWLHRIFEVRWGGER